MRKLKKIFFSVIISCVLMGTGVAGLGIASYSNVKTVEAASSIRINKSKVTLIKGQTTKLKIVGTKKKAKWYTSKKSVAVVTQTGKIVAKNKGVANIIAKIGNKKFVCRVTIEIPKMSKTSLTLTTEGKYALKLTGTKQKITWKSSNKSIATVSQSGVVTAKKVGKVKIRAIVSGKSYVCNITITKAKIITVDKNNITIKNNGVIYVTSKSGGAIRYDVNTEGVIVGKWGEWSEWKNGTCSIPLYITAQINGTVTITITDKESGETVKVNVTISGLDPVEMYNNSSEEEKLGVYAFYVLNDTLNDPDSLKVYGVYTGISNDFSSPRQLTIIDYAATNGYGGYTRSFHGCWRDNSGYFHTTEFSRNLDKRFPAGYTKLNPVKLQYIAKNVTFN